MRKELNLQLDRPKSLADFHGSRTHSHGPPPGCIPFHYSHINWLCVVGFEPTSGGCYTSCNDALTFILNTQNLDPPRGFEPRSLPWHGIWYADCIPIGITFYKRPTIRRRREIKQDRFNIVLPLHQTLRPRSRTVPFLFKRSELIVCCYYP